MQIVDKISKINKTYVTPTPQKHKYDDCNLSPNNNCTTK